MNLEQLLRLRHKKRFCIDLILPHWKSASHLHNLIWTDWNSQLSGGFTEKRKLPARPNATLLQFCQLLLCEGKFKSSVTPHHSHTKFSCRQKIVDSTFRIYRWIEWSRSAMSLRPNINPKQFVYCDRCDVNDSEDDTAISKIYDLVLVSTKCMPGSPKQQNPVLLTTCTDLYYSRVTSLTLLLS